MSERRKIWRWFLTLALLIPVALQAANPQLELQRHALVVDGHPFAVWSKVPAEPRAVMLLIHGRTWSTRPDFDLQVPGEDLSLMDGLAAMGIATYGLDLRGYGETPRDASGWLTPDQAASAVEAPVTIFRVYSSWPGQSATMNFRCSVAKKR